MRRTRMKRCRSEIRFGHGQFGGLILLTLGTNRVAAHLCHAAIATNSRRRHLQLPPRHKRVICPSLRLYWEPGPIAVAG